MWLRSATTYVSAVNGGAPLSEIAGPFSAADVAANCSGGTLKEPVLWVISYALMAVCALVLIILLLLLVLPCRRRDRSGEITDESSLVRHRIKWLRGNRVNGQGEQSPSMAVEKGVRLNLHQTATHGSECLTDSRLHAAGCPTEVDTGWSTSSWRENPLQENFLQTAVGDVFMVPMSFFWWYIFLILTDNWSCHSQTLWHRTGAVSPPTVAFKVHNRSSVSLCFSVLSRFVWCQYCVYSDSIITQSLYCLLFTGLSKR